MNIVVLMGRLTRDPEVRYSQGETATAVANYRLAVDRRFKREGQPEADFFDCVCFGRQAEFAEKYLRQGMKMVIQGRLQNDNYQGRDGQMVYRTRVVIESQEFAESKAAGQHGTQSQGDAAPQGSGTRNESGQRGRSSQKEEHAAEEFLNIPEGIDEELPFN